MGNYISNIPLVLIQALPYLVEFTFEFYYEGFLHFIFFWKKKKTFQFQTKIHICTVLIKKYQIFKNWIESSFAFYSLPFKLRLSISKKITLMKRLSHFQSSNIRAIKEYIHNLFFGNYNIVCNIILYSTSLLLFNTDVIVNVKKKKSWLIMKVQLDDNDPP